MMMKCAVTVCIACLVHFLGNAATYYVATNGNNSADGSAETPWLNIWKAAATATAGDTVIVGAGDFNEFVTNTASGDAVNPITFTGTRGAAGEWLTIIDPSTLITNDWVAAPEIGSGVYKLTNMTFQVHELTIDHKRVAFVYTMGDMSANIANGYSTNWTTGAELLALPSDVQVIVNFGGFGVVEFWDGVEALYGTATNTGYGTWITYLRLRDGSDPNGLNIRAAPNRDNSTTRDPDRPAVRWNGNSYITWRNFKIRGAFCGTYVGSTGAGNIIESNSWCNGESSIIMSGAGVYSNIVQYNLMTTDYYGYSDCGGWGGISNYVNSIHAHLYALSKFIMGGGAVHDIRLYLAEPSSNNIIHGNIISNSIGESIQLGSTIGSVLSLGTKIVSNTICQSSAHGIMIMAGHTDSRIYDNYIYDHTYNLRFHLMDAAGETNRIVYIYRNTFWQPTNSNPGHIFTWFEDADGVTYYPEFWVYHNSFSGGESSFNTSAYAYDNGGHPGIRFLNNIFSGSEYIGDNTPEGFLTNSAMLGAYDYNLVTPPYPAIALPAWFGTNNITNSVVVWNTNSAPNFLINAYSPAIDAAIDVTQPFVINGVTNPALPATDLVRRGTAWDMGALEYEGFPILRVGNLFSAPK